MIGEKTLKFSFERIARNLQVLLCELAAEIKAKLLTQNTDYIPA